MKGRFYVVPAKAMTPQDDPSWQAYPHTVLRFHGPQTVLIDLRQPVKPEQRQGLCALGLTGPFAVLTAYNPTGRPSDHATNRRRTESLRQRLAARTEMVVPTQGGSPDGAHQEPGFAVMLAKEEAVAIGKEFDQSAMFWWDGIQFWLVPALVDEAPLVLPRGGTPQAPPGPQEPGIGQSAPRATPDDEAQGDDALNLCAA